MSFQCNIMPLCFETETLQNVHMIKSKGENLTVFFTDQTRFSSSYFSNWDSLCKDLYIHIYIVELTVMRDVRGVGFYWVTGDKVPG